ncbi:MAG: MFS transporter [Candidatus Lokiarchaeota archaeon]|nr:MFS transporter [Candidatus Lokiarchaeota archaeon]
MSEKTEIRFIKEMTEKTGFWNAAAWFTYDAADTYFSQLVISLAYTPFALLLGIQLFGSYTVAFVVMSIFMAISNLLVAIFGPMLGSMSDIAGKRKGAVIMVGGIMIATSAAISIFPTDSNLTFWVASILFLIANFCYQCGRMFYDAQIPFIAQPEQRSVTQAIGGSLSFIGSVLAVLTSMFVGRILGAWTHVSSAVWDASQETYDTIDFGGLRYLFVIGAIIIFIMAFPYLFHKEVQNPQSISLRDNWAQSRKVFRSTGLEVIRDRNSVLFFLAWFFITDSANTAILYMSIIIQGAVGYDKAITDYVIFAAIGGSFLFAFLTGLFMKKSGPKKSFIINALCWAVGILIVIFSGWNLSTISPTLPDIPKWLMFLGAIFIGVGFGGIWIIGRQFIVVLAPPDKLAQYGGFQKIAGRVSAIVSPIFFSLIMFFTAEIPGVGIHHAYRFALGQLFVFFLIGMALLFFITDPHERYNAGERAPYKDLYVKIR